MMIKGKRGMAFFQIILLISFSFAIAFILGEYVGVVSAEPSVIPVATMAPAKLVPGETFMTISSEGVETTALWTGTKDGTAYGVLANGKDITWPAIPNSEVQIASVSKLGGSTWGKTMTFGGKEIAVSDALTDPGKLGMLKNGKLTTEASTAFKEAGIQNIAVKEGAIVSVAESGGGFYAYEPFGIDALKIGGASAFGGFAAHLVQGAVWAGIAYGVIQLAGSLFDLDENLVNSLSLSAVGGIMTWKGILALGSQPGAAGLGVLPQSVTAFAPWIGLGVGVAIFIFTYKKTKQELVRFECLPWEPPTGGQNCEKCNEGDLPCSEYRCKSLGQACNIINPGTEEEACVWINKGDTAAPIITVWEEALKPEGLNYVPDNAISPPNKGFKLLKKPEGCLDPFTKLEFGILTDEPAQCMIDYDGLTKKYDEMTYFFGEQSLYVTEHTQKLKVPSPFSETGEAGVPEIHNDGTYTLAVRCRDANGNENVAAVAFSFCVQEGPDVTQPVIEGTSIESGKPVTFGADNVPIEVYVNEPAECKWSHQDKAFEAMENTMSCATETFQINTQLNYVCSGTLTGIKDREDNSFYFRCKDYSTAPGGRNEMTKSYQLVLKGTEELAILNAGPEGEFEGSTSVVEVVLTAETGFGADNGNAVCYISTTPEDSSSFWAIDSEFVFLHNQSLFLPAGDYTYHFRCIDAGGNSAEEKTMFKVVIDDDMPQIVRIFRDGAGLKVITGEPAQCAYSLTSCSYNFEDGVPLVYADAVKKTTHLTEWDSTVTYHIKCRDLSGNQPPGTECSIIAQGSEL